MSNSAAGKPENKRRIKSAKVNLDKVLKRIEPFQVKRGTVAPSTAGSWCASTNSSG